MNCYYHPDTTVVATCQDCNKGLCKVCSDKFTSHLCVSCIRNRVRKEKKSIIMELITMIAAAFIGIFLTTSLTSDILTIPILQMILMLYLYIGLVAGWNYINEQKKIAFYFSTIPLLGFLLKIISASILGLFITPFRIKNKISRLKQIHLIETID